MADAARPTVIYTCCGGAGGWSILRSLQSVGRYRLVGVDNDPLAAGLYAEGLDGQHWVPRGDDSGYAAAMREVARREKAAVVWPCSDEEVLALAAERDSFEEDGITVVTADADVVGRAVDKLATVRRLEKVGVPVPKSCALGEPLDDFRFPVIIRPITARSAHGVHFFETPAEVEAFAATRGADTRPYFVQENIAAPVGRLHMAQAIFDSAQSLKAFFSSRSIRTRHDWGGPALGGVAVRDERLKMLALKVFAETGPWYGPVNAEFLYDAVRQDFVFIEVNPRYWGYSYLATAAGINFPDLTVRLALGEEVTPVFDYRTDVVTMTSREQISFPLSALLGPLPAGRG